jgi:hypothetical protein
MLAAAINKFIYRWSVKYSTSEVIRANDEVPNCPPDHTQNCSNGLKEFNERFHLVMANTDIPIGNRRYIISSSSGERFEGCTDSEGYTQRIRTKTAETLTIELFDDV